MRRLLYISHRVPYPPDKGERVRAFHEIQALSGDFEITLASLAHEEGDFQAIRPLQEWCAKVIFERTGTTGGYIRGANSMVCGRSVTEGYFHSSALLERLKKESRRKKFHVAIGYSSSMLPYLRKVKAGYKILDLIDVDSAKWQEYAECAGRVSRWIYRREGEAVYRLEQDAILECDKVFVVSEAESRVLGGFAKKVGVLENGVDLEYFTPQAGAGTNGVSLVFTGTMDYRPNAEGVGWFAREVWPDLRREFPGIKFYIVGRNPTRTVCQLGQIPGIEVTGTVSDVRSYVREASVAICPLQIARGIQNKVLEAMAMGKAVVASRAALEGIEAEAGKDVLAADSPLEWKEAIRRVIADDAIREELGRQARKRVEGRYRWDRQMLPLVRLCREQADRQIAESLAGEGMTEQKLAIRPTVKPRKRYPQRNGKLVLGAWLLMLAYLGVVIKGSLMSPGVRIPFIGEWGGKLAPQVQDMLHMPAYAVLMCCISLALTATFRNRFICVVLSILFCIVTGVLLEEAQKYVPGRVSSSADMYMNIAGTLLGLPAAVSWRWRHNSPELVAKMATESYRDVT